METMTPTKKKVGRPRNLIRKERHILYLSPPISEMIRLEAARERLSLSEVVDRRLNMTSQCISSIASAD